MKKQIQAIVKRAFDQVREFGSESSLDYENTMEGVRIDFYTDVPVVVTDADGTEYWITVQRKRK